MKVTIEVGGSRADYDGAWHCSDPELLEEIQEAERRMQLAYCPNPFLDMATEVATILGGRVVKADQMPAEPAPVDAVY